MNDLEDDLPYIQYASVNGNSFSKNFLQVGSAMKQPSQKGAYFVKTSTDTDWSDAPSALADKAWIGYRIVYTPNNIHYLVVVIEVYPVAGRIWSNHYQKDINKWDGWKSVTPS